MIEPSVNPAETAEPSQAYVPNTFTVPALRTPSLVQHSSAGAAADEPSKGQRRFRHADNKDIDAIQAIFARARHLMAQNGNPSQWGSLYPLKETVQEDLRLHRTMLLVDHERDQGQERILAVFSVCEGEDPTYQTITDGQWLNDEPYVALHRVASAGIVPGVSHECLNWVIENHRNVRGDTHERNKAMQHVFESAGFKRCGIVHLINHRVGEAERIAYHHAR
ncbi:N-acetyltransferase [Bifidobacterium psychraerophilum]|uniref:N-acetyltransferase n=1 Tax=Bifidobacterium psychraerophilum TaxID=218140 RepID=UPI003C6C1CC6